MAPGGFLPRWQSLTQWLSAVWRLLWWLRQQTTRKVWRPPAASETLLGGLEPTTRRAYEPAYEAFHALLANCDVFVSNYRLAALARLKVQCAHFCSTFISILPQFCCSLPY